MCLNHSANISLSRFIYVCVSISTADTITYVFLYLMDYWYQRRFFRLFVIVCSGRLNITYTPILYTYLFIKIVLIIDIYYRNSTAQKYTFACETDLDSIYYIICNTIVYTTLIYSLVLC